MKALAILLALCASASAQFLPRNLFSVDGIPIAPSTLAVSGSSAFTGPITGGTATFNTLLTTGTFTLGTSGASVTYDISGGYAHVLPVGASVSGIVIGAQDKATYLDGSTIYVRGGSAIGTVVNATSRLSVGDGELVKIYADGVSAGNLTLYNNTETSFGLMRLGGATSSFPAIKRNGTAINIRLADDSGDAPITAGSGTFGALSVTGGIVVTGTSNAASGIVGEYMTASVGQGSATALTTATPKTITSVVLTAGDWDITGIGCITGASTGTEFDVAIGATTNSLTGTVLGDTRCQTPTVSLAGADASLMVPSVRASIASTSTYYLIIQETFTVGTPAAYGRISARRAR